MPASNNAYKPSFSYASLALYASRDL